MNAASNSSKTPRSRCGVMRRHLLPWVAGALLLVPMAPSAFASNDSADGAQRKAMSRSSSSKGSSARQSSGGRSRSSSSSSSRSSSARGSSSSGSSSRSATRSRSTRSTSRSPAARSSSSGSSSRRQATPRSSTPSREIFSRRAENERRTNSGRPDVARTRPGYGTNDRGRDHRDRNQSHRSYDNHRSHRTYVDLHLGWWGLFGYPYYYDYGHHHYGHSGHYYGYGYPRYAYYRSSDDMGALDLNVRPKKADVYVNGQRIGNVGEFDGFPGYLWLEEGIYDLVVYHPGYQTLHQTVEVFQELVIDIDQDLAPGDATRPEDIVPPPVRYDGADRPASASSDLAPGRLFLDVEPLDASVYLDGRLLGSGREIADAADGLMLNPGKHQLSVLHPSYDTRELEIDIEPGEATDLEIHME